jgi:hypothetical protein
MYGGAGSASGKARSVFKGICEYFDGSRFTGEIVIEAALA